MSRFFFLLLILVAGSAQAQNPALRAIFAGGSDVASTSADLISWSIAAADYSGTFTADALDDSLTNVSGTITATGFDADNHTPLFAETAFNVRNVEGILEGDYGAVHIRCTADASRSCLTLYHRRNVDLIALGFTTGVTDADGNGDNGNVVASNLLDSNDPNDLAGYTGTSANANVWTLGANEGAVYLELNGTEVWRDEYVGLQLYDAGTVAWWIHPDGQLRGLSAQEQVADTWVYGSSPSARTLDARDFGFSSLTATGDISTGSNTITLDSNPGFAVGDPILLQTTKLRGDTTAVNGYVWRERAIPTLADTTRYADLDDDYIYVISQDSVYYQNDNIWAAQGRYARAITTPKSLATTITGVSGTTLTLDSTAVYGETGVTVAYDNTRGPFGTVLLSNPLGGNPALDISLPAGTFYLSDQIDLEQCAGCTLSGAGMFDTVLKSARGFDNAAFDFSSRDIEVSDLRLEGNYNDSTLYWNDVQPGLRASNTEATTFRRVSVRDYANSAIKAEASDSVWVFDSSVEKGDCNPEYVQWSGFQAGTSFNSMAKDFRFDAGCVEPSMEPFWSNGFYIERAFLLNGFTSHNGSGGTVYRDVYVLLEEGEGDRAEVDQNPIFNFNSNAGGGDETAPNLVERARVVTLGPLAGGTFDWMQFAIVNPTFDSLNVIGGFYHVPPAYQGTADTKLQDVIRFQGDATQYHVVDGFRNWTDDDVQFVTTTGGEIKNTVSTNIEATGATLTSNQTLAVWQAGRTNTAPTAGFRCEKITGTRTVKCATYTVASRIEGREEDSVTWLSTDDAGIKEARWTMGDGTSYDMGLVFYQYATGGSVTVELTVEDENGATDTASCSFDPDTLTAQTCS